MSEPGNRILVVTGKEDGLRGRALQTAVTRRALQPKHCTTQRLYREHKIELTFRKHISFFPTEKRSLTEA